MTSIFILLQQQAHVSHGPKSEDSFDSFVTACFGLIAVTMADLVFTVQSYLCSISTRQRAFCIYYSRINARHGVARERFLFASLDLHLHDTIIPDHKYVLGRKKMNCELFIVVCE